MNWLDDLEVGSKVTLRESLLGNRYPAVVIRITTTMLIVAAPEHSLLPVRFWKKSGVSTREAFGRDRLEEAQS